MKIIFYLIAILLCLSSCGDAKSKTEEAPPSATAEPTAESCNEWFKDYRNKVSLTLSVKGLNVRDKSPDVSSGKAYQVTLVDITSIPSFRVKDVVKDPNSIEYPYYAKMSITYNINTYESSSTQDCYPAEAAAKAHKAKVGNDFTPLFSKLEALNQKLNSNQKASFDNFISELSNHVNASDGMSVSTETRTLDKEVYWSKRQSQWIFNK